MKPDFGAQFRSSDTTANLRVYMGGTAMSCGEHPSLPKRHRWSKPRSYVGSAYRDRMCLNCALCEDAPSRKRPA